MKAGIIKADGTSRLMRATLPATYEAFRAAAAAGTLPLDVLFNESGWSQQPTFLNKANLLKDATAAMFGLGADAVPDHAFAALGKYNYYWWKRRYNTSGWKESRGNTVYHDVAYVSVPTYFEISYSDSIRFDSLGKATLVNPDKLTGKNTTDASYLSVLLGKYIQVTLAPYTSGSSPNPNLKDLKVAFVPEDTSDFSSKYSDGIYVVRFSCAEITGVYDEGTVGAWETVQSVDRNAYPDSGVVDGYEYEYLGIPFDNAVEAIKIETGSYFGTGTFGAASPSTLTFSNVPKMVVIKSTADSFTYVFYPYQLSEEYPEFQKAYCWDSLNNLSVSGNIRYAKFSGTTLSWYYTSSGANYQMNTAGTRYEYLAFI